MDCLLCGLACLLLSQANHNNTVNYKASHPPKFVSTNSKWFTGLSWLSGCYSFCCVIPGICCLLFFLIFGIVGIRSPSGPATGIVITILSAISLLIYFVILVLVTVAFIALLVFCIKSHKSDQKQQLIINDKFYDSLAKMNAPAPPTVVVIQNQTPSVILAPQPIYMNNPQPIYNQMQIQPNYQPQGQMMMDPNMQNMNMSQPQMEFMQ
jgi:hypothetical protein